MATALLSPNAKQQFFDNAGAPAAGFKLYTYAAGTINPQATYQDRGGTAANANPIILDARGEAIIYLTPGIVYDYALKTAADAPVWTREDVVADATDTVLRADLAAPATGAALVGYQATGTGMEARDVKSRLDDEVSVFDAMTSAQRTDVRGNTGSLSVSAALQAAIDKVADAGGGVVKCPPGVYRLTAPIIVPNGVVVEGSGCVPYTNSVPDNPKTRGGGTWFHADHAGVAFQCDAEAGSPVGSGAMLRRFGIFRTHAAPAMGWTPTVYDFDILTYGVDLTVEDVTLLNAYKGIKITSAGFGRLHVNRVKMQAFHTGIDLDQSLDTCRIENVQIWPFWSDQADVRAWTLLNLKAFRVSRSDNAVLYSCFSIYHNVGVYIDGDGAGNTAYHLRISNCNIDPGAISVKFASGADNSTVLIENTVMAGADEIPASIGIVMECDNARLGLSNCDIGNYGAYAFGVTGTGNLIRMSNVHTFNWNKDNAAHIAIQVGTGNTLRHENLTFSGGNGAVRMSGLGTNRGYLGGGSGTGTTDANGIMTVAHGLGCRPRGVLVTLQSDTAVTWALVAADATNVQIKFRNSVTAAPMASAALGFYVDYFDVFPA